jgi:transposase
MITVDEYGQIRRAHYVEHASIRRIAREQGHSRKTVRKALKSSGPGHYTQRQPRAAPRLGPYKGRIEALLEEAQGMPRKQRYTGHKIYEIIRAEGYADAQADWGDGDVIMNGKQITVQVFSLRLCYSRRLFVMAFPTQKLEAFLEAHVQAFRYFEGVPHRISYDNLKTAVKDILTGHQREEQAGFVAFRSHYLFESHFCTPGQGHEKGGVEHGVGYGRRNFLVPLPVAASFEELNAYLLKACQADDARTVQGQPVTIGEAWQQEKEQLLPLPAQDYPCCTTHQVTLTPYSQVIFETNRYSVPVDAGRRTLTLRAYAFRVEILREADVIARHARCYGHGQDIFDPLHYLALLAQRPGAFDYAKPIRVWRERWPDSYEQALNELRHCWPDGRGVREFIQILQLHQTYPADLIAQAIQTALTYGCVHYEGVRLCLNQLLMPQQLPLPLDLAAAQLAPLNQAGTQPLDIQSYDQLLGGV